MASPNPAAAAAAGAADPQREREVWMACAGPFASLPSTGAQVYYFPRRHADQCGGVHHLADKPLDEGIPCIVSSVELHYRAAGDPYAMITLQRDQGPAQPTAAPERQEPTAMIYYVKQLGGTFGDSPFAVPKSCADEIFPTLVRVGNERASQTLEMVDVHGVTYEFNHILNARGANTLAKDWNKFHQHTELEMGKDAVVFMRSGERELLIGSRRGGPNSKLGLQLVDHVRDAAVSAAGDQPFTVIYYPRQGWPFVVPRKEVDDARALNINWRPGMDVRMAIPVDAHEHIASRRGTPNFFHGVISVVNNNNQWCKLQVDWNGSSTPNSNVNVWQVEAMEPSSKKRKASDAASSSGTGSTLSGPGVKTE